MPGPIYNYRVKWNLQTDTIRPVFGVDVNSSFLFKEVVMGQGLLFSEGPVL